MSEYRLSLYMATWGWQIQAILFLVTSIVLLAMQKLPYMVAMFFLFVGCEFMAWKRKRDVEDSYEETTGE